ncbi:MAG: pyridoxal-phosphate dependent enzyme [bacterium]|nr:pyridoxal-phosphate dependent enzyme [bacterium]
MIPLFEEYPTLKEKLPFVSLGEYPTKIIKLKKTGKQAGLKNLYLKQDGLSALPYGGNKVRKLEFLLGKALQKKARAVLTFGYAGSNHALATTIYAEKLGLESISMLMPQHNAHYVRENLLAEEHYKTKLCLYKSMPGVALGVVGKMLKGLFTRGSFPKIIPPGGSSPLGAAGFVNAAFELKKQVEEGLLPEPDYIYAALGTMGTAAGLMLGLKAAGLKSTVVPIRVVPIQFANEVKLEKLFYQTNAFLRSLDSSFPRCSLTDDDLNIRHNCFGKDYARFTEEGVDAVKTILKNEKIKLEGTYTGKAFAALLKDARETETGKSTVLFWNTANSHDLSEAISGKDYHVLPRSFHRYFEEEVQELDK